MAKPRVLLVVEGFDDRDVLLNDLQADFTVQAAADGVACLRFLDGNPPDLILLDTRLSKPDWWGTLRAIRANSEVPIIMLTASGELPDQRRLPPGADDSLSRPFSGRRLVARIHSVLQRANPIIIGNPIITRGNLVIGILERRAVWRGRTLKLTGSEFGLLRFLAAHAGEIITHDRLVKYLRNADDVAGVHPVDYHVTSLRTALGDGARMIGAVPGVGYRFTAME